MYVLLAPLFNISTLKDKEPMQYLYKLRRSTYLDLKTRNEVVTWLLLKHKVCTLSSCALGTSINDFSFFGGRPST